MADYYIPYIYPFDYEENGIFYTVYRNKAYIKSISNDVLISNNNICYIPDFIPDKNNEFYPVDISIDFYKQLKNININKFYVKPISNYKLASPDFPFKFRMQRYLLVNDEYGNLSAIDFIDNSIVLLAIPPCYNNIDFYISKRYKKISPYCFVGNNHIENIYVECDDIIEIFDNNFISQLDFPAKKDVYGNIKKIIFKNQNKVIKFDDNDFKFKIEKL